MIASYDVGLITVLLVTRLPFLVKVLQVCLFKCIQLMKKVPDIESLAKYNSLNYEVLKGDKNGISSIRVNDKYRVEFTVRETMEEPIIIVCNIIDLSNHYKQ